MDAGVTELSPFFLQLGLALGLGLLVGLQRQRSDASLAGIRTFPLVTVMGTVTAWLAESYGGWLLGVGVLAVVALAILGNVVRLRATDSTADPGLTTEFALVLMFCVGAYAVAGEAVVAVVLAGGLAVLLQLKEPMHRLAARIGDEDFRAVTQFILISLVILPVLPNRTYGPYDVLNPRQAWWMVVLIVGISLGGYACYRLFGGRAGSALAGLLGGLISSTATTVSYARRSHREGAAALASLVIVMSSTVVFVRVLVEIAAVAPGTLPTTAPPLLLMLGLLGALAATTWRRGRHQTEAMPAHGNPSELRSALVFAALYAVVLLAVAAAREHLGEAGLYAVAVLSGLTDMDAITLSTSQLMNAGRVDADTGWRLILTAGLANLAFKLGAVAVLGSRELLRHLGWLWAVAGAGGLALLWLWP